MSDNDLEQTARIWLEEGPTVMPDRGLSAALEQVHTTRQRRAWLPARRIPDVHNYARLAIGVAAVAVVAVVGINLLDVNRGNVAAPTASPAASGGATPLLSPSNSPSNSPAAQVDGVQDPASSGDPAPSGSPESRPPSTADPELVRAAAALQFHALGAANLQAFGAIRWDDAHLDRTERAIAEQWGQYLAALNQLQVPADTAADVRDLIRKVRRVQAADLEASAAGRNHRPNGPLTEAWWRARRHIRDRTSRMVDAGNRVRSDLGLPASCNIECQDLASYSYP